MATLAQLLAQHRRILVLDAVSSQVQVGLLREGSSPLWQSSPQEAGAALFAGVDRCLATAQLKLAEVHAFLFCEGPGSLLGARTAAMAIRTWQTLDPRPAYSYRSLILLSHQLASAAPGEAFAVVSDARRDTWNCVSVDVGGSASPLRRLPREEIAGMSGRLYTPAAFRAWAPLPQQATECAYDVAQLLDAAMHVDLFSAAPSPDTFQFAAPEYKKWSAQIHSAESAPPR